MYLNALTKESEYETQQSDSLQNLYILSESFIHAHLNFQKMACSTRAFGYYEAKSLPGSNGLVTTFYPDTDCIKCPIRASKIMMSSQEVSGDGSPNSQEASDSDSGRSLSQIECGQKIYKNFRSWNFNYTMQADILEDKFEERKKQLVETSELEQRLIGQSVSSDSSPSPSLPICTN